MSGLSSPPNGRPGRKAIPRALRLNMGLPVCANPTCDRAPARRGLCRQDYDASHERQRAPTERVQRFDGPTIHLQFRESVAINAKVIRAAAAERISASEWVRRAIAEKLARP